MVAEQVLRDLSVRRSVCADVPDVSNAERSGDLSNVASRAEALRQCKLGFSTDKMVGDKVLTARCRWYGTASVSAECQYSVNCVGNRCRSHDVCRVKATPTVVHCRMTSEARPREHCAMRTIRPQRLSSTDRQHQLSRRHCISRVQLEEELKVRRRCGDIVRNTDVMCWEA